MQNQSSSRPAYVYPIKSLLAGRVQPDQPTTPRSHSTDDLSMPPDPPTAVPSPTKPPEDDQSGYSHPMLSQYDLSRLSGLPSQAIKHEIKDAGTASGVPLHALGVVSDTIIPPDLLLPVFTGNNTSASTPRARSEVGERSGQSTQPGDTHQIMGGHSHTPPNPTTPEGGGEDVPFNISESGIVHLPPLPTTQSSAIDSNLPARTRQGTPHRRKSSASSGNAAEKQIMDTGRSGFPENPEPRQADDSHPGSTNEQLFTTVRFRAAQDDDGHHVIVGREGEFTKCEDEPIRTPGAVQGFGVLIALDEVDDRVIVRQVSENSQAILGLSPKYLFNLSCFTETLPESQASILLDNIQFLADPSLDDEASQSPHVFLLRGWGEPGLPFPNHDLEIEGRPAWTCWCAVHRATGFSTTDSGSPTVIVLEFELERDTMYPLYPPLAFTEHDTAISTSSSSTHYSPTSTFGNTPLETPVSGDATNTSTGAIAEKAQVGGLEGDDDWVPNIEDIIESTTSRAKPIPALERLRKMTNRSSLQPEPTPNPQSRRGRRTRRGSNSTVGMMDVFAVTAQINEQLGAAPDLDTFLKVVVGLLKDLTQFHRVMVYQFDEMWNGQVVAELFDWSKTHDLYKGLHFPAGDIPAQARALYAINKVRLLYDRDQPTACIVVRNKYDLDKPLDMTHCYLRAMSPIHIKYLGNMGVRASMSISILAFGQLWGLVTCHSYGDTGMRVSFPIRQMLRLLSQSISRNIERLSYARRLHTRKLLNTLSSDHHPTGYIVSNADDLLGLFDADFGILVVGEGAKILGPNQYGQEILIIAEYLRMKEFSMIQASQAVVSDYPDLPLTSGLEVIAGLLYVPLSRKGKDFIAFLRKGQPKHVRWAGKPPKPEQKVTLEPRQSFRTWSEIVAGRCRAWTDTQLETAGVLALVYGKFIEVWRQKETAMNAKRLTNLLLSNASHDVRTPLNHIINYLEVALDGSLDPEIRQNLEETRTASKSLLFTINDLLDLTRLETGNETSFNEPFDLPSTIEEATQMYRREAGRRKLSFTLDLTTCPTTIIGDAKKIRTVVQNMTANALKYTNEGGITVRCSKAHEPEGLRDPSQVLVEIDVIDSGRGIAPQVLDTIFREFEQVEPDEPKKSSGEGVGLGLAVVARIVEQLGGQLRVQSDLGKGSHFSFLIPLTIAPPDFASRDSSAGESFHTTCSQPTHSRSSSVLSTASREVEGFVNAISKSHMWPESEGEMQARIQRKKESGRYSPVLGQPNATGTDPRVDSPLPIRPVKVDEYELDKDVRPADLRSPGPSRGSSRRERPRRRRTPPTQRLRILIVEDDRINRTIIAKRLAMDGHTVVSTVDGQEALDLVKTDRAFDVVLMDLQMPILNGYDATRAIRQVEDEVASAEPTMAPRLSHVLNNNHIPIFAVSASLVEGKRHELEEYGMDGWILKPVDFKRLRAILQSVTDPLRRESDVYRPGYNWEAGGWLVSLKA